MAPSVSEHTRPTVGIGVLIWRDGKVLISKRVSSHGAGTWSIPGGKLEHGESWEACAARETKEETGVKLKNIRFLAATNDIFISDNKHFVSIWMQADWAANEPQILEPEKHADLRWASLDDLPKPLFEPCWTNLRKIKPELFAKP